MAGLKITERPDGLFLIEKGKEVFGIFHTLKLAEENLELIQKRLEKRCPKN